MMLKLKSLKKKKKLKIVQQNKGYLKKSILPLSVVQFNKKKKYKLKSVILQKKMIPIVFKKLRIKKNF